MIPLAALAEATNFTFLQAGWNNGHMSWGWGGWLFMSIAMALFWGSVLVIGIWLLRLTSGNSRPAAGPSALDIARDRYARGELSDEEFRRIKKGLE